MSTSVSPPFLRTAWAAPLAVLSGLGAAVLLVLFGHAFSVIEWECVASRCTTDAPQAYYGIGGLVLLVVAAACGLRFLRAAAPTALIALAVLPLSAGFWLSLCDTNTSAGWTATYAVVTGLIGLAALVWAVKTGVRAFHRSGLGLRLRTTRTWADARLSADDGDTTTGLVHFRAADGTRHLARATVPAWAVAADSRVIFDPASPTSSVTVAEPPRLWWPPRARARRRAIAADLPLPGEQTFSEHAKAEADTARAAIGLPPAGEAYVPRLSPLMRGLAKTMRAANSARAAFREGQEHPDDPAPGGRASPREPSGG
ncbi:hypothetical protein [Klugiella xanthotipulae]|uniref:hypothetical protein n=1 Tax=Klugiella xanthotipulae TaxID=244735 RepID=UPI00114E75A7|nr:hypothetical protein [Klugiella xanthotipulae]